MYDPLVHGESALNVIYFNNFQCPDNATSLDDCTVDLATIESCYSQQYVIRCFDGNVDNECYVLAHSVIFLFLTLLMKACNFNLLHNQV